MDWNKFNQQLRIAVDTGKVLYGTKEIVRETLVGDPKLVVLASTVKVLQKKQIEHYCKLAGVKVITYLESGVELGSVCGKPFSISVLGVLDVGESSILAVMDAKDIIVVKENARTKAKTEKKEGKVKKKEEKDEIKKAKEIRQKEEEEKPIQDDELFKSIIKIKKK
ncbi:MAG: 50S ribosomal protein L30e [archaeon]